MTERLYIVQYNSIAAAITSPSPGIVSLNQTTLSMCCSSRIPYYYDSTDLIRVMLDKAVEKLGVARNQIVMTMLPPCDVTPEMLSRPNADKWWHTSGLPICRKCWMNYAELGTCLDCEKKEGVKS